MQLRKGHIAHQQLLTSFVVGLVLVFCTPLLTWSRKLLISSSQSSTTRSKRRIYILCANASLIIRRRFAQFSPDGGIPSKGKPTVFFTTGYPIGPCRPTQKTNVLAPFLPSFPTLPTTPSNLRWNSNELSVTARRRQCYPTQNGGGISYLYLPVSLTSAPGKSKKISIWTNLFTLVFLKKSSKTTSPAFSSCFSALLFSNFSPRSLTDNKNIFCWSWQAKEQCRGGEKPEDWAWSKIESEAFSSSPKFFPQNRSGFFRSRNLRVHFPPFLSPPPSSSFSLL